MNYVHAIVSWVLVSIALPLSFAFAADVKLDSPLAYKTVSSFVENVLKAVVLVALPIIALFIMYAGFKYIMARGSSGKLQDAHQNFMYVVIGALLIMGAWILATLIGGTISQVMTAK